MSIQNNGAKQQLVVLGAGGHAKVVLECLQAMQTFDIVGIIDPDPSISSVLGFPVLGGDDRLADLFAQGVTAAVIAIGSNLIREQAACNVLALGYSLPAVIHPSAIVSPSATIAPGAVVMARAAIGPDTRVEELAIINTGSIVEHENHIGRSAHIASGAVLAGNVKIGDRALVGSGSAVVQGITIGDDAIIGAGSAVVRDVSAGVTAVGVPARALNK